MAQRMLYKGLPGVGEGPPGVPALHLLSQRDSPLIEDEVKVDRTGKGAGKKKVLGMTSTFLGLTL